MSGIKFDHSTKEIELKGSESFIKYNFSKIHSLLVEHFGVKKMNAARKATANREALPFVTVQEPPADVEMKKGNRSEAPPLFPATESSLPDVSHESTAKRAPLRKYIRREGSPGQQRMVVEVVEQKPREISLASLKEKFGLSESKIGGIIRDAEKLGKIRKARGGSYIWSQE